MYVLLWLYMQYLPQTLSVKKLNIMPHNINFMDKLIPFSKRVAEVIIFYRKQTNA